MAHDKVGYLPEEAAPPLLLPPPPPAERPPPPPLEELVLWRRRLRLLPVLEEREGPEEFEEPEEQVLRALPSRVL